MKAHGINAASITYDSREILSNFSDAYKIEFPLLSDAGSKVIRAFGILNTNVPEDHKMMYGMPWPGEYLIAPDGTVRDKVFLRSYEHRPVASEVVLRNFDSAGANSVEINAGVLKATVALSTDRCFTGQELGLALEVRLEPGWHIYGQPLPASYQAVDLTLESPLIAEQSLELPAPTPLLLKALGETLPVYGDGFKAHGKVGIKWSPPMPAPTPLLLKALGETLPVYGDGFKAHGKVGIKWSPPMPAPFLLALGEMIKPGPYQIGGTLRFQACSDEICEPPQAIKFVLPLTIEAGVPAAPKKST